MNKSVTLGALVLVVLLGGLIYSTSKDGSSTVGTQNANTIQALGPTVSTDSSVSTGNTAVAVTGTVTTGNTNAQYWFEYSTDANLGAAGLSTTAVKTASASATVSAVTNNITGLKGNTTYYFHLVGQNAQGTTKGNTLSFKTK